MLVPLRVLFVREVGKGSVDQETSDSCLNSVIRLLEREKTVDHRTGIRGEMPLVSIEVVGTLQEALESIQALSFPDMVVFNSCSMENAAKQLNLRYPKIKVVILTGLMPENTIAWVPRSWLHGDMIRDVFCGNW